VVSGEKRRVQKLVLPSLRYASRRGSPSWPGESNAWVTVHAWDAAHGPRLETCNHGHFQNLSVGRDRIEWTDNPLPSYILALIHLYVIGNMYALIRSCIETNCPTSHMKCSESLGQSLQPKKQRQCSSKVLMEQSNSEHAINGSRVLNCRAYMLTLGNSC
jgi:hypothetical protein